jgi:hypothetical protein
MHAGGEASSGFMLGLRHPDDLLAKILVQVAGRVQIDPSATDDR